MGGGRSSSPRGALDAPASAGLRSGGAPLRGPAVAGLLGLALGLAAPAPCGGAPPPTAFDEQISVGLRQVFVSVVDRRGRPVRGLERQDFRLEDAGEPQELVTFEAGGVPFSAILLVDASGSMAGPRLEAAVRGVEAFTRHLEEHDLARLLVFTDHLRGASPWSGTPEVLSSVLRSARGVGGSAVVDHLYLALRLVHERAGRPVVVLLSDGWDMHSTLRLEALEEEVRAGGVQIYWLRDAADEPGPGRYLGPPPSRPGVVRRVIPRSIWRDSSTARIRYRGLERLVHASGGRTLTFRGDDGLEAAFTALLDELRAQYALGYYPETRRPPGSWRPLEVDVERGRAHTRAGYEEGRRP